MRVPCGPRMSSTVRMLRLHRASAAAFLLAAIDRGCSAVRTTVMHRIPWKVLAESQAVDKDGILRVGAVALAGIPLARWEDLVPEKVGILRARQWDLKVVIHQDLWADLEVGTLQVRWVVRVADRDGIHLAWPVAPAEILLE